VIDSGQMPRVLILLLSFGLLGSAADKDPWIKVTSTNFELFTTAGERAGRDLIKHFEQVHSFFIKGFGMGIDPSRKARVILFRNEKEYDPYRPSESAAAFFHPGEHRDFIVMNNSIDNARPVAVHELTHLLVHQLGLDLPPWLNEGLAEVYSNLEPRGSQIMVGRDIPGRMRTLATEKWIDLRTLLAADRSSPYYNEKARAGMFYAESWKLVHMLQLHPDYRKGFGQLLKALGKQDPETAFLLAFGKSLDQVEHDLQTYLSNGTISAVLFDVQLPKSIDAPVIEAGAALPARLALAEMLSNTWGRAAQAGEAYSAIEHDYPNRWEVAEAMGLFAWHERKLEDAAQHFAKAEEMGCQDGVMFLLWGRVLGFSNRSRDAVAALGKAARLMPESTEVQLEYGNALVRNGNWGAAVGALRTVDVKKVPPSGMWRYRYNLAYGLYKLGETAAAKEQAAKARTFATSVRDTSSLDQLVAALDRPSRGPAGSQAVMEARPAEEAAGEPPRLLRREPARTAVAEGPPMPSVQGTLENMECGTVARLHVRVDGMVKIFIISDPNKITIVSGSGQAVSLECGIQKQPASVRVEYQAVPGEGGSAGLVRSLEFK
jgi:tetratricopeptide (TPR) repeat protein